MRIKTMTSKAWNKRAQDILVLSRAGVDLCSNFWSGLVLGVFPAIFILTAVLILAYYVSAFYPGYLTPDSIYILSQGLGDKPISNWHPPFVTVAWGVLYGVFKGTGGIWVFQVALFILAANFFVTGLKNKVIAFFFLCFILLYAPIFTNMAALWKDDFSVVFTLFCAGFAIRAIRLRSQSHAHMAGLFFVLASLTRIDYFIVAMPIAFGAALSCRDDGCRPKWHGRKGLHIFAFYVLLLVIGSQLMGGVVQKRLNPWETTAIWDIGGVMNNSEVKGYVPGYRCDTSDPLIFGDHRLFAINLPEEAEINDGVNEAKLIRQAWVNAIISHPAAYLKHRLCIAKKFFGIDKSIYYPYPSAVFLKSRYAQNAERSALNIDLYWFYDSHANGLMFRYYFYLVACFLIFVAACLMRKIDFFQFSLFASICMSAARFVVLPAADFRYGLWMVVGTLLMAAVFIDYLIDMIGGARKSNFPS